MLDPFHAAVAAAYHLVMGLTTALTPITGGLSAAVAIVVFTAGVRLALLPLSRRQARAAQTRLRLEPAARELRARHRADPVRAHREVTDLYRAEGTSTWAGTARWERSPACCRSAPWPWRRTSRWPRACTC